MRARLLLAVLVVLMLPALAGCEELEKRFTPPPNIVTEEATRAAVGAPIEGDVADGLPEDFPLWPNAKVIDSGFTQDKSGYRLVVSTKDTFEDVLAGYGVGLGEAGWEAASLDDPAAMEATATGALRTSIISISREGLTGILTIAETGKGTVRIDVVISKA